MAQAIFQAVIDGDIDTVKSLLQAKPAVLKMRLTGSPAKYRGNSPLQVAICVRQYAIAERLIQAGADVNYMDPQPRDDWIVPVVHDAVKSAVYMASSLPVAKPGDESVQQLSDAAFAVLSLMLEKDAQVDALDSYGNTTIHKAAMAVSEFYPWGNTPGWVPPTIPENVVADYERIFAKLYEYGADPDVVDPNLGQVVSEHFRNHPVGRFLIHEK